ncbi:MFS general substrate transporter [Pleurotus eryngii]|uniref:MFS general substrate transporter n=1 Tax=Pleurotus eryngii TaxID=5323 RepID=A0A9P5ZVI1_PLEER|nr:MFS general substrate transporter [Pleurotus eryngii]
MSDLAHQDKEAANDPSVVTHASSTHSVHDLALERRVWRKLDLYVLPVVVVDRTNIGNARIAGLQEYLRMTDTQYSITLTMTYVPYIVGELPSNLLLRSKSHAARKAYARGVVTALQGLPKKTSGLLAARFSLGYLRVIAFFIAKSLATQSLTGAVGGVVPGLVLYLSFFYPRHKMKVRTAVFFSLASLSGAFCGILAFGIIKIEESPTQARPGWAWVFILEGLFTVLLGIATFFFLPCFPKATSFFTPEERDYVAFVLLQVVMLEVIFFFLGVILIGLALFTSSIIVGLGYTSSTAQLMSVPPFVVAFVVQVPRFGLHSILYPLRDWLRYVPRYSWGPSVQYCSLFFSISGGYAAIPAFSTWSSNNNTPHTRRASAIAINFVCFNAGGILVTWLLRSHSDMASRIAFGGSTIPQRDNRALGVLCRDGSIRRRNLSVFREAESP